MQEYPDYKYRPRKKARLTPSCLSSRAGSRTPSPGSSSSSSVAIPRRKRRPAVKLLSSTRLRITVSTPPKRKRRGGGDQRPRHKQGKKKTSSSSSSAAASSRPARRKKSNGGKGEEGTACSSSSSSSRRTKAASKAPPKGAARGVSKAFFTPPTTPPSPACPSPSSESSAFFVEEEEEEEEEESGRTPLPTPSSFSGSLLGCCSVLDTPTPSPEATPTRHAHDDLGDLSYLADILQMSPEFPVDLDLTPELDLEPCSASTTTSASGSHFEFSCTPDVADALCDVGLAVSDWLDPSLNSLICS